ncbi:hypothetical protein BD410DRAFT_351410 [Rickenella mellea]|uniref:Uncharacterized protein n=1 Tax=Rickenella mellea TaxID=50990 RepID=A0A4Y7QKP0_9AGAM|nr:hypothetical protein BD410DRAFT_351410 [Rickenella mellea]
MPPYPGPPHSDASAVWSPPFIHNGRPNFSAAIQNGQRAPNVLVRHHDQWHNPDRRVHTSHTQPAPAWPMSNTHEQNHFSDESFLRSVQSLYDDPAFSTDPRHHPDFVMTSREQIVSAPPPTYAVPRPPESLGSPAFTFTEHLEAETSFPNAPFPSPPLPTPPYPPAAFVDQQHTFKPAVATAEPQITQRLGPPPMQPRAISDPLPATTVVERPQLERKGNSSPPLRRPPDLDKIDELDETDPLGVPWHHGGRYEVLGNAAPLPDQVPQDAPQPTSVNTIQGPAGKKEKRVKPLKMEEPMLNLPPAPIPYSLNLQPGQVLRTQTNMETPRYGSNRALAPVTAFPYTNFEPPTTPSVGRAFHDNGGPTTFELIDPPQHRTPFNQGPQATPHRRNLSLPPPYTDRAMLDEYHDRNMIRTAASPTDNLVDQHPQDEHMINGERFVILSDPLTPRNAKGSTPAQTACYACTFTASTAIVITCR